MLAKSTTLPPRAVPLPLHRGGRNRTPARPQDIKHRLWCIANKSESDFSDSLLFFMLCLGNFVALPQRYRRVALSMVVTKALKSLGRCPTCLRRVQPFHRERSPSPCTGEAETGFLHDHKMPCTVRGQWLYCGLTTHNPP